MNRRWQLLVPEPRTLCIQCATISIERILAKGGFFVEALCDLALHLARRTTQNLFRQRPPALAERCSRELHLACALQDRHAEQRLGRGPPAGQKTVMPQDHVVLVAERFD